MNFVLNTGLLLGHVRDGRYVKTFAHEDMAAEYISIVKMYDPQDDFIYVVYPHTSIPEKFIIAIFGPQEHFGEVAQPVPKPTSRPRDAKEKIRHKKSGLNQALVHSQNEILFGEAKTPCQYLITAL